MSNAHATRISHRLRELNHLFNLMGPSPFIVVTSITKPESIVTSARMWVRLVAVHPRANAAGVAVTPEIVTLAT